MLTIKSFFVGGKRIKINGKERTDVRFTDTVQPFEVNPNGMHHVHQAYVQAFIPELGDETPVILQHGGGMTGVTWESTPDGFDGWLNYFVAAEFPTYVIDNVARGRASWPGIEHAELGAPILRTEEEAWSLFRFGKPENYAQKKTFPGMRFPVRALKQFVPQFVPRWIDHQVESAQAIVELLEKLGSAVVVAHSQGSEAVLAATKQRPELVKSLVLLEPSALPNDTEFLVQNKIPVLVLHGDNMDCSDFWRELLITYKRMVDDVCAAGGDAKLIDLSQEIGAGFSHMLMMDKGSKSVFNLVHNWIKRKKTNKSQYELLETVNV